MKIPLPDVTLVIVDCVDYARARMSFEHNMSICDFGDAKLLTDADINDPFVHRIPSIRSIEHYSRFMIEELTHHFDTPHVLVAQWDGFIWNPALWSDEFLNYDYVGAPWPSQILQKGVPKNFTVGNGGFSLRSKRLQDFLSTEKGLIPHAAEDVVIGQLNRAYLECMGFRFAPEVLARRFSWEYTEMAPAFGVHARLHLKQRETA